ncbi:hypothetical protein LTR56_015774 [Elasticomyces elasticus]|nr:hypothetical protein LTR56_015774 [Elasticomyces elasticus]KAK3661985.1 hypothetical protein LTR22_007156 [Elasticomyces elasticus]KAK4933152.1 hypothetical protein LTR49_000636 [Elasticomyces elasticus]KAK5755895.1 hypothetical protein LTS12_014012 [Elasticomyces elasticus]
MHANGTPDTTSSARNATYQSPSLSGTSSSIRPSSSSHQELSSTQPSSSGASSSSNSTTSTAVHTSTHSSSSVLSVISTTLSSTTGGFLGSYIRSGIGYSSSENNSSTTQLSSSSSSLESTIALATLSASKNVSSNSETVGGGSSTRNITVIRSSYSTSTLYSLSTGATGYSPYSHGVSAGSETVGVNASSAHSYDVGNATSAKSGTSTLPSAFSMPSQGFTGSDGGNSSGVFASGTITASPTTSASNLNQTTALTWTTPANASSVWQCNDAWYTYTISSGVSEGVDVPEGTTIWATNYTAATTTLCDGFTRIVGDVVAVASGPITTDYIMTAVDNPVPTCSIPERSCASMQSEFASYNSIYESAYTTWHDKNGSQADYPVSVGPLHIPQCAVTGAAASPDYCGACTIYGGTVEGPYVVTNGTTFYEDKAYISYQTAYAINTCGRLGNVYTAGVVPVASSNIYSMELRDYFLYNYANQFNFADLNHPIPASAYLGMPNCKESDPSLIGKLARPNMLNGQLYAGTCPDVPDSNHIIWDALYQPVLAVPPEMRALDPAWSNCILALDGLWDPPKALQPASTIAAPTAPTSIDVPTTPASPAQTPTSPASTTLAPATTPPPAESDTQGSSTAEQSPGGYGSSTSKSGGDGGSVPTSSQVQSSNGGTVPAPTSQGSGGTVPGSSSQGQTAAPPSYSSDESTPVISNSQSSDTGNGGVSPTSQSSGVQNGAGSSSSVQQSQGGSGNTTPTSANPGGIIVSVITHSSSQQDQATSIGNGAAATPSPGPGNGESASSPASGVATIGSSTFVVVPTTNAGGSSVVVIGAGGSSATLAPGQTTSVGGQDVSVPSSGGGAVIGNGASATIVSPGTSESNSPANGETSVISVGSSAFTVIPTQSAGSSAVVVANGGSTITLAPGSSTNIGNQEVSAPSGGGAVIGSGNDATTVAVNDPGSPESGSGSSVVSVGSSAFTVLPTQSAGSSAVVIANGGSTVTLAPGQSTTIGNQIVSAPASGGGAVIGTGNDAATVQPIDPNASSGIIATVGGQTIAADPSNPSNVLVNGQTLTAGQTTIISGTPVYIASGSLLVGGSNTQPASTFAIPTLVSSAGNVLGNTKTTLVVGGHTLTASADSNNPTVVIVDGTSVTLGGSEATINGVSVSLAPSGLVVDGFLQVPATPIVLGTVTATNGQTLTLESLQGSTETLVVDGSLTSTLNNGLATVAGVTLSAGSSGGSSYVVADGSRTVPLSSPSLSSGGAPEAVITLNGQTYTASSASGNVVVDGTTLSLGGPAATINGVVLSDASDGIVVGGTQKISFSAVSTGLGSEAVVTLPNGDVLTAIEPPSESYVILNGITLLPGGTATIHGTVVTNGPNGLVIAGNTVPLTPVPTESASQAIITINGQQYTAIEPAGAPFVIVDGTTLSVGGSALTIDGTIVSEGSSGLVVGGTQTIPLSSLPPTTASPTPGSSVSGPAAASTSTRSAASSLLHSSRFAVAIGFLTVSVLFLW